MRDLTPELRKAIVDYASRKGGTLYAPVLHPDFAHYPASHGESRWELIRPHLEFKGGRVLDIGSHWGYIPWQLERLGYRVLANENSKTHFPILKGLRDAGGLSFDVSDVSFLKLQETEFDIVFALNIFHHFIKLENRFLALEKWLCKLDVKMIILQVHAPWEAQMTRGFKNLENEDFANWVASCTGLACVTPIGIDRGRQLFKIHQ